MCRWVGYLGSPIAPRELLHDPQRSLIEQSRRHAPNMEIPNGDGTGLGWYEHRAEPALFRSITPAWGDENLLELATEIRTPLFLAHVRAGTGTPVQLTNCHPFRYRNWLFVHNGYVGGYSTLRRDLLMAVRPDLFGNIAGSTDSELLFHLALTFGLTDDPIAGIARMAGFVEAAAAAALQSIRRPEPAWRRDMLRRASMKPRSSSQPRRVRGRRRSAARARPRRPPATARR